ncbi:hypothetical protein J2797_006309, partial [Paraburkholderia terricola]|nr:hypothetical protein [Paraburkholderia terricola]
QFVVSGGYAASDSSLPAKMNVATPDVVIVAAQWLPWYFIRPVVSLILGGVSYLFIQSGLLLLGASHDAGSGQNQLGIWAMTFLAGLNVDKFLTKIEAVGQSVWGIELSRQSKQQEKIESERP